MNKAIRESRREILELECDLAIKKCEVEQDKNL